MFQLVLVCSGLLTAAMADSPSSDDVNAYQTAAARAGGDADAHVRLASWCEAHGLAPERQKHLMIALQIAPDHPAAHGLLGQLAEKGQWRTPEEVAKQHASDAGLAATLERYHARREKIADTAEAHWQLAEWCGQNGLEAEALVHLTAVTRLDPSREEAWRRLGYRKQKGRWITSDQAPAERAEAIAQRKAEEKWRPLLQKWSGWLGRKGKRAEAESAMAAVSDAKAVPSIWSVFAMAAPAYQERAALLLRQIDAPSASQLLASLSVLGGTVEVRRLAAGGLVGRDPREFAGALIGLLRDPVEYEVRPVKGPGSPGELYIRGERANSRFFYAAPPPLAALGPTDFVGFDEYGLPVANRAFGFTYQPAAAAIDPLLSGAPDLTGAPEVLARAGLGQTGQLLGQRMLQNQQQTIAIANSLPRLGLPVAMPLFAQLPVGQLMVRAQQQAALSQSQLLEDVAAINRYNADVNRVNERAALALKTATAEDLGSKRSAWEKWWSELVASVSSASPRPRDLDRARESSKAQAARRPRLPAFGAETPVWTISGLRPIELIRAGDQVLTQNATTGALGFAPVLTIRHSPLEPVMTVGLGQTSIVVTDLERLWAPGKGWVKVFDLKPGDIARILGSVIRVSMIKSAGARAVYQIQVPSGLGIFVDQCGILVHDDRIAHPVSAPFDAAAKVEAPRSRR